MKKFAQIAIFVYIVAWSLTSAHAYGGGVVTAPGLADNPSGLVCELVDKELPNGKVIKVPFCHFVSDASDASITAKLKAFALRVINGGDQ
jgi:hypothetical protein